MSFIKNQQEKKPIKTNSDMMHNITNLQSIILFFLRVSVNSENYLINIFMSNGFCEFSI